VTLRACVPGDEHALALLGAATFLETYAGLIDGQDLIAHVRHQHDAQVYAAWLAGHGAQLWIAEVAPGASPVGYLVLTAPELPLPVHDGDREVRRLYVLERYRRSGAGRRLMAAAAAQIQGSGGGRLLLGVYSRNAAALAFYAALGYLTVGTRQFQVGSQHYDDYILALELPQAQG
jgi:ribosomal protein S18 acetylase RimI-like enzyme